MRVLYIEDNNHDADLTRRAVAHTAPEMTLEVVGSLIEAQARLGQTSYDLALVDMNLPDGDGMSLLPALRALEPPVAAVVITGLDEEQAAVAALRAGADDYVVKRPGYLDSLPRVMADALRRRRERQAQLAEPIRVLAAGLEAGELHTLQRQLSRYAPHIGLEQPEFAVALASATGAYDAILVASSGSPLGGLDSLKLLRQRHGLTTPVVLVADADTADIAWRAINLGAADYVVRVPGYLARLPVILENSVSQARLARTVAQLRQTQADLEAAYDSSLEGWARALDLRDHETEGHTRRVTVLATRLGAAFGLDRAALVNLRRGALLHDIGKMAVPDRILHKPGPLTDEEWVVMRRHPEDAYQMLREIAFLREALEVPYCHHERWDGSGYPQGLRGEAIPLAARIFAVVDVWDAITSRRAYRDAMSESEAIAVITRGVGVHFDPAVARLFLERQLWRND